MLFRSYEALLPQSMCPSAYSRCLLYQVDLACDTENALLDVFEGEKCIYEAKVTTPAVCQPLVESPPAQQHHSAKDEL